MISRCAGLYIDPPEDGLFEAVSGAGVCRPSSSVMSDWLSASTLMMSSVSVTLATLESAGVPFPGLCSTLLDPVCDLSSSNEVVECVRPPWDLTSLVGEGASESTYCRVSDARSRNSSAVSFPEMTGTVRSVDRTVSVLSDGGSAAWSC